ncbi:hypothetical protein JCM11491_005532 [Sporobolomyces phaffii]
MAASSSSTSSPPSSSSSSLAALRALLARPAPLELSESDVRLLLSPSTESRPLVLAVLARSTSSSSTLDAIQSTLAALLSGTDSAELVAGLSLVSNLVHVAPELVATRLVGSADSPLRSTLRAAVEHISSSESGAVVSGGKGKRKQRDETLALVELLSLASGLPPLRELVDDSAGHWLDALVGTSQSHDPHVTAWAAVGLVKLQLAKLERATSSTGLPPTATRGEARKPRWSLEELAEALVDAATRTDDDEEGDSTVDACLEGLAYLTLTPSRRIKEVACRPALLDHIFSYAPLDKSTPPRRPPNPGRDYSIATLLHHLTAFPLLEDAESDAAQVERLKRFAARGGGGGAVEKETVEQVTARVSQIVEHSPSPIPTVRHLCLSPSLPTRRLAGSILHALVTPQRLRGRLLQAGVHRLLLTLVRHVPTPFDVALDLAPVQALSKLLITANPLAVFGPTAGAPLLLEATTALTLPLATTAPTPLLATFESLMALTNVASLDPDLTDRIARIQLGGGGPGSPGGPSLLGVLEELVVHPNGMVARAATELVCNLVASESGIAYFEPPPRPPRSARCGCARVELVLALSTSDDVPTRLAASGALTSLVSSELISTALATRTGYVDRLLGLLEDDDAGVRHRAYEVWRGIGEVVATSSDGIEKGTAIEVLRTKEVVSALEMARDREDVDEVRESVESAIETLTPLLSSGSRQVGP